MSKWKRDSDKVVIKNIMIIQMENSELMDELQKELNLKQYMASNLSNAFEISPNAAQKVKREVEKKEYYCKVLWEFEQN